MLSSKVTGLVALQKIGALGVGESQSVEFTVQRCLPRLTPEKSLLVANTVNGNSKSELLGLWVMEQTKGGIHYFHPDHLAFVPAH